MLKVSGDRILRHLDRFCTHSRASIVVVIVAIDLGLVTDSDLRSVGPIFIAVVTVVAITVVATAVGVVVIVLVVVVAAVLVPVALVVVVIATEVRRVVAAGVARLVTRVVIA